MANRLPSVTEYILRVKAGPDYENLVTVGVNDEFYPIHVNNDYFTGSFTARLTAGYILIRIRGFTGLTPDCEKHGGLNAPKSDVSSRYLNGISADLKVLFGVDSNKTLMPIPGISVGLRICKWLDPALEAYVEGDSPHLYSPFVSCMNSLAVFDMEAPDLTLGGSAKGVVSTATLNIGSPVSPAPSRSILYQEVSSGSSDAVEIKPWAFARSNVPDHTDLLFTTPADAINASTYEKRKRLFGSVDVRKSVKISPDYLYCMDFYDAYFDLETFAIRLPGFTINAFKYWDGSQPLRYVLRSRDTGVIFFVVQMFLGQIILAFKALERF